MTQNSSMSLKPYNRQAACDYALQWALDRNPQYYNFSDLGGDCTNFASQVLFAGGALMNFTPDLGWYYRNSNDKSPSWSGVEFLYDFLVSDRGTGPVGDEVCPNLVEPGDLIQLSFSETGRFNHTLVITQLETPRTVDRIFVSGHSQDQRNEPLKPSHTWSRIRFLHILGSRA